MATPERPPADSAPGPPDRLGYFMVRIRRAASSPLDDLSGVVERLGSGEKREFRSCDDLIRLVDEWTR